MKGEKKMTKTILSIDGMVCSMCESHVNEAVRKACPVRKVTSSYRKGESEILSDTPPDEKRLREAIEATGYRVLASRSEPYEKKGLFGFIRK